MPRCGIGTRSVGKDFTGRPFGWLKASDLSEMKNKIRVKQNKYYPSVGLSGEKRKRRERVYRKSPLSFEIPGTQNNPKRIL